MNANIPSQGTLDDAIAGYVLPDACPCCGEAMKELDCTPYLQPNPQAAKAKVCLACGLFLTVKAEQLDDEEVENYKEVD